MHTKMRPRYYCDHCKRGNGSPSAMRRHESGCTLNPRRVCRMCRLQQVEQVSRDALVRVLDSEDFKAMCDAANQCPACILAVLRTKNYFDPETGPGVAGPEDGRESWNYRSAKDQWWREFNDANAESLY